MATLNSMATTNPRPAGAREAGMSDWNDTLAQLKRMAAANPHGLAGLQEDYIHKRTYLSMGVVKLDDNVPNWDTQAMEEERPYGTL